MTDVFTLSGMASKSLATNTPLVPSDERGKEVVSAATLKGLVEPTEKLGSGKFESVKGIRIGSELPYESGKDLSF